MARCGAKTRNGHPCQSQAMPNGRCRMHGGSNNGAPAGNKNAAKPGSIYSKYLTDEEQADFHSAEIDQIDQELRLTKVLLNRVLMAKGDGYDLLADRYLARIESLTKTREDLEGKRLTNEKLRRELEDPNQGLPEPKQVIIGVEDASDPEAQ